MASARTAGFDSVALGDHVAPSSVERQSASSPPASSMPLDTAKVLAGGGPATAVKDAPPSAERRPRSQIVPRVGSTTGTAMTWSDIFDQVSPRSVDLKAPELLVPA